MFFTPRLTCPPVLGPVLGPVFGPVFGPASAAIGFALFAFCATPPAHAANDGAQPGFGASGNYLAGRHAEQIGESLEALNFYARAVSRGDLTSPDLQKRIYILALTEGRIDDALLALDKVQKADAEAPFANLLRATQALKMNEYASVAPLLKDEKVGLVKLLSPALIAWAKVGQKDHKGALEALSSMKKQAALKALHDLHAALIEEHAGNVAKAETYFLNVLKSAGLSTRVAQLLGGHFERLDQYDKAFELYEKFKDDGEGATMLALAQNRRKTAQRIPLDVATPQAGAAEALYNIASVLQKQAGDSRVLVLARLALYLRPDMDGAKVVIAATLEANQRYADANAIYANIPQSSPLSWSARMHTADNLDRLDQTDDAVKLLRTLARERPQRETPLIELGGILRRHERFKEAAEAYTDALKRIDKIEPHHWVVYYARGVSYEQTDRWPQAEADFLKALEFDSEQPTTLNYLGYLWIDKGQNLDRALQMIEKAVDLRPRDGYIVDSLGWGLYRLGQFDKATKKLERAVMLRPEDPVINDHLGDALWKVGRTREAHFQWQRAKGLEPDEKLLLLIDQKLKGGLDAVTPQ